MLAGDLAPWGLLAGLPFRIPAVNLPVSTDDAGAERAAPDALHHGLAINADERSGLGDG